MKKSNKKGEPFEELSVVTSAGLGKGKRRDKSINKKAGLHDKKADEDETRVFRRKPLAVKHKRRIKKLIPALLAILSIAMVIVITGSYAPPASFEDLDGDFHTVCLEVPDDSSSPEEHTVVETIGYLNYTLQHQPYWSSEMEQSLSALFNIKQNTYNYKKYYNNTLISVDIAKGASTSAKQFCQTDNVVLWRDAVDPGSADGFYADWKQGKPSGLSISEFKKKRGLPPGDFSVYVLNENTIYNAQEKSVVSNGDGTYSVTADLNVNTKGGVENDMCSAVYYYKQQMAVTGGLSQLPSYTYTNVTYTFDENYRVLSFEINDSYEATLKIAGLGEVTSGCTSTTNTVFSYKEEDCKNSVYDYFKDYIHDFGSADDESQVFTVNATNCLAGAFGSVLSDGAVFKLDLGLGGKTVEGVVAVSLKDGGLDGIAAKLGNITVHAVEEQEGYTLYLALGQNKYKYNLGALTLPVSADEGDGDALSDILDALLGGDFVYDSQNGLATLNSEISLSGIDINLNFAFAIDEEKEEISLIDVKANITYGDIGLDATLKFGENKDKPADLTPADKTVYKDIVNDGIELGVGLTLGGRKIDGVAKIDLSGGEFVGVRAKLGEITVHYEGNNLYIASGDNKYVLGLDALGGSSLPASVEFDINSLLAGLLESISIENGIIKAEVFGAEIALDLFDGIKASAYIDMFGGIGLEAYLSSEPVPARLDEAAKAQYTDILNDGIAVGVNLDLGGRKINGVAKIDLSGGEFVGVRAKLGEITVHYEGNNLYIASGDNKYVLGLDALGGSSLPASVEFDVNSLLAGLLESISIENGIIKAEVFGAEIALNLFEGVTVSAYIDMFGGIGLEAYLSSEPVPARLDEAAKAQYTDILNDGIAVGVNLDLGGRKIDGVAKIDLSGGEFVGVRAQLGDALVHYADDNLYISISGSKIRLPSSVLGTATADAGGFELNGIIDDILNGVHIQNGIIYTSLFGAEISLDVFGGIKAAAEFELFGANIKIRAALAGVDSAPDNLTPEQKAEYVNVAEGFSLSGMLDLTLGGEQISLAVNNLAVSFENTFSFKLDTVLLLNNTYNNFYIEYSDGVLTVTYGAISPMPIDGTEVEQNVITVQLDILGGDLEALEEAVVSVYNRVIAVYNEITKQNVKAAGELNDILKTLGIAKDGVDGMSEILEKLALPVADGKLDMDALLKSIVLGSTQDGISVSIGNIFAELVLKNSGVNCGANIKFGTSSFGLAISDVTVSKYQGFDVPCESPLDREGFIQLLDYLGATAEMLLQHNITLNLEGTLYNTEAVYNEYGNIKYIFNALLEYYDGGSMPITFENGQLYVSDEMYLHFKLDLIAQADVDESLYLEVYILDGHPVGTDDSGFTKGGYEKDGGLDFFVSVSKLADGTSGKNSLKFYGSMEEVLSIASMGVTMLNLQDINTTSDKVNETIASIYDFLNGMLIENYIPTVKSQFESLGASLLPNILKTDLSTLLNKIIAEYERIMDGVEHKVEITEGNFIKRAAYADGRIDVALNSATLFGVPEYEDLTFYITKTMGENSLISGLGINNIYFGDNGENKLNLSAGIGYDAISKPDSQKAFEGYHNFEGLDKLLLAAVSSATHETTDEERAAGYFADYKLNNDYCVGGDISLSILGNDIVITINTLHITIDENNEVSFDINLSYNKEKFWGMVNLITDNAMVDISIKKDMVYIRKAIDKGATSYRVMPVNVFMDDMFNQLSYVLSFGDTINKLADQFMSGSSEKIMPTFADYGDYISKFINVYTYSESASEWKITVRGDTLGGMAGMSGLKDITVTINGDGNNLKSLSLNGGLSIISFSGTLDYLNPNEKFAEGKSDLSNNVATLAPDGLYYSWTEILGGETFDEIDKHFMWSKLMGGKTGYLSYAGDGTLTFGGYTYLGASYSVGDGYAIGTLSDLSSNGIKGVKLDAVWMKYAWSISASRSGGIKTGYKYSYTIAINSLNVDVVAKAQVIEEMKLSYSAYGYVTSTSGSESHNGGDQFTPKVNDSVAVGDGHCSLNIEFDTKSRFTSGLYLYGHANLDFSLSCKGYALFSASEHKNQWL